MRLKIEVHGFVELKKALHELEPKVQKRIAARALRRAMAPVLAYAKEHVPVDEGKLRDGLKLKVSRRSSRRPHRKSARVATPKRSELDIPANATGYYPAVLEYGSDNRQLAPRPYLRPALAANADQAVAIMRDELAAGIKRQFRRRFGVKKGLSFPKLLKELQ